MWSRLAELYRYRYLVYNLVLRDLKVRYRNSVLGVLWSLLNPLFMMLVFTVVFTVMNRGGGISRYPLFVLAALLPWNFLSGSVTQAVGCIVDQATLVKKVYFPREVLPLSVVLSNMVHFLLALSVYFPLALAFRAPLTPWVGLLPVLIGIQFCLTGGIALVLSTLNVFYRDTKVVMEVLMLAWFFLTPIFYPIDVLPRSYHLWGMTIDVWRWVRILNPMASLVAAYQDVLYWGRLVGLDFLARTAVTSVVIFVVGYAIFCRYSGRFAEEV